MAECKPGTDHVNPVQETGSGSDDHQYPFASAPDIIRSNQKDAYFQSLLLEHVSSILRRLYGARFAQTYTASSRVASDLLYLALTTMIGNRTLGEEYCDIIQIEDDSLRLPTIQRRAAYILTTVLLPYALARIRPAFRRRVRAKLESNLCRQARHGEMKEGDAAVASVSTKVQSYVLAHLDTITSPSPVYAVSLATFYFSGAYYQLAKRLTGLRYIFTKRVEPGEQRVGYEVLGVLLVLQMAVQGWLHMHHTLRHGPPVLATRGTAAGASAVIDGGVEVAMNANAYASNNVLLFEPSSAAPGVNKQGIEKITHTPLLEGHRYDLHEKDTMQWIQGRQQRKCTLCLEEIKDPSATTCGHVFCWTCIGDWCREKPECPLCRQTSLPQHILPLRG